MKTIVGLFDTFEHAEQVVRDLESAGFKEESISLMAPRSAVSHDPGEATEMGAIIGAGVGILTGLATVTIPGVGVVLALGPIVAGGILGAVAGGLAGNEVEKRMHKRTVWVTTVVMKNGRRHVFETEARPALKRGDVVTVEDGHLKKHGR